MIIVYLVLIVALVAIDQFVKYLTVTQIQLGQMIDFIPGFMSFTHLQNFGAAWSMFEGQMLFFIVVTLAVVAVAFYFLVKNVKTSKLMAISLSLIIGGGIGNLIDRVRQGFVTDMFHLDFMNFPIFNVADIFLVVGVGLIFVWAIVDEIKQKGGA